MHFIAKPQEPFTKNLLISNEWFRPLQRNHAARFTQLDIGAHSMTIDDILILWHRWAKGYQYVGDINSSPTFRECRSNHRQWASLEELADEDKSTPEAVDHVVMSLCDVYRTALQIQARNLCTGREVWISARLPKDPANRAVIVRDARDALARKLRDIGIL